MAPRQKKEKVVDSIPVNDTMRDEPDLVLTRPLVKWETAKVDSISLKAGMDVLEDKQDNPQDVKEWVTPETQTASAILEEVREDTTQIVKDHLNKFKAIPHMYSHAELDDIRKEQFEWLMKLRSLVS